MAARESWIQIGFVTSASLIGVIATMAGLIATQL
jgi:hypothetical protein